MRFLRHVTIVAIFTILSGCCLPESESGAGDRRKGVNDQAGQHLSQADGAKLYTIEDKDRDEFKSAYPELFSTPGVVAVFGIEGCAGCRRQKIEWKGAKAEYNILFYDASEEKVAALMKRLELGKAFPTTVTIEKGVKKLVWIGYTPWHKVKPYAAKAKKPTEPVNIKIGPLKIDIDGDDVDIRLGDRERRRGRLGVLQPDAGDIMARVKEFLQTAVTWLAKNWTKVLQVVGVIVGLLF